MKRVIVLLSLFLAPMMSFASAQTFALEAQGKDQYYSYNFGTVFLNSRLYVDFTLTAKGPEATQIRRILISGMMYNANSNCPEVLNPGQTCTTRVFYWPTMQGPHWGELTFVLNDGRIFIRLFGDTFRN